MAPLFVLLTVHVRTCVVDIIPEYIGVIIYNIPRPRHWFPLQDQPFIHWSTLPQEHRATVQATTMGARCLRCIKSCTLIGDALNRNARLPTSTRNGKSLADWSARYWGAWGILNISTLICICQHGRTLYWILTRYSYKVLM